MAELFAFLFLIALVGTIVCLIKPSFTQIKSKPALPRKKILLYGLALNFVSLMLVGIFAPTQPKPSASDEILENTAPVVEPKTEKVVKTQAEIDKEAEQYRLKVKAQQQELADEDRPQVEVPAVDYTSPVAKVDLKNDQEIVAAVGLPVVEKEKGSNQNGEPMTTYYFSQDLRNGLELGLSREFVDVAWKYDSKDATQSYAAFETGQQITRALLGGKDGAELYEKISKGGNAESYSLKDGPEIHNARCGQSMCRYQVVR